MGRYDDITPEQLQSDLVTFARLILRMDRADGLLDSPAQLQRLLGELRQKIFAYEIRASRLHIRPSEGEASDESGGSEGAEQADPMTRDSQRVVRDALRRTEEMLKEWGESPESTDPHE